MMIHDVTDKGDTNRRRRRVGRGRSSGSGKTCGKGHKGYKARSGPGPRSMHEGGQMPIFRRMPKRGFNNYNFRDEFEVVSLAQLDRAFGEGDTVNLEALRKLRLIQGDPARVKVLGTGKLSKKLTIEVHALSDAARKAIEGAGGTINQLPTLNRRAAGRKKRNSAKGRERQQSPTRLEKKNAGRVEA